jgi:hypothetical protein
MKEHNMSIDTVASNTHPQRKDKISRSERNWIDATGAAIEDDAEIGGNVKGFSYHLKAVNKTFTKMFDLAKNPNEVLMLAAFGGMTLAGNVANGKTPEQGFADIEARFALIENGTWVERVGVGGPRYVPEVLARAISTVKHGDESQAGIYLAKMGTKVKVRNGSGQETEMDYGAFAKTNTKVGAAYDKLMGKAQATLDAI